MKPNLLERFWNDDAMREAVRDFQIAVLNEMIIEDCYNTGSESGKAHKQTKELIDKSFLRLNEMFGRKEEPKIDNPR